MTESNIVVFVIDDDASVRRGLTYLLQSADYRVETFESAEKFLARQHFSGTGCIILDVRLTGMTGLDLQEELGKADYHLPIIFMTGQGDIPMGVDAMKKGASDFLVKPFDDVQFLGAVKRAVEQDKRDRAKYDELQSIRRRLEKLTPREYEIFRYVITGLLNKQIATELNIAEQTVKIHRGRVMEKLGAYSVPDLVRMAATADAADGPPLFRKVAQVFGVLTFPSDDHIGEYLAWGAEYSGVKWKYGREHRAVTLQADAPRPTLADYASGQAPLDAGVLRPSGEITVPVILDMELDRGSFRHAVNVLNRDAYIPNLPRDAAVEVPARVDRRGLHPLHVPPIPDAFAAILRTQCTINALVTEAYRTRSRQLLLQALLLDPCVNRVGAAEQMLDEMLKLQRDFLPEMK